MNTQHTVEEMPAELDRLLTYLDKTCVRVQEFGCFAALSEDKATIFTCAINVNGFRERDPDHPQYMNWNEVTAPEPEFLDQVNARFGTSFRSESFPGR